MISPTKVAPGWLQVVFLFSMGGPIKKNAQYFTEIHVLLTVPETSIGSRHHLHLLHCVLQGLCDVHGDEADE